ncbi:MAG: tetratricopeptide repeat protein [Syntrophobacterales bacterium]|nr:MAG: tetratricopeptide repeat protein [Syntrophobacterales bacterium]
MRVSHCKVTFLRIGIVTSTALILLFGGVARAESGDDLFSQGMKAYQNGEYQLSIDKLSQAIPLLKGDREKIEAFKTMAFAYMAFPKKEEARQQFCNILKLDPTFELDPIMTPPKILAVFGEAKEKCLPFGGIEVHATSGDQKTIFGAKVYLNGDLIGETPLERKDILPGEYELEVNQDGFRSYKARVSIEERVILNVKSTLIEVRMPTITSINHDATAPLAPGDRIEATLMGDAGKAATFDLGDGNKNLPMNEVSPGRYVGIYRIGEKDQFSDLTIVGHLEDRDGVRASMEAKKPISTTGLSRSQHHFRRGKVSMEQGEYDLAIDSLSQALYEDPNFVDAHILLAKAYYKKKGAYLESIKYLKKAIELDGDNLEACSLLAKIYIENGKYGDAFPVVKKILGIAPDSGFAYGHMGEILSYKGKHREAIETLRKSLQLDQGNPRVYFLLGNVFERLGRLADAVLEYETAVELSPTTYQYRDALATCYRSLNQEMSAFRHWKKCLELGDLTELERRKVKRRLSELRR